MGATSGLEWFAGVVIEYAYNTIGEAMTHMFLRIGAVFGYLFQGGFN